MPVGSSPLLEKVSTFDELCTQQPTIFNRPNCLDEPFTYTADESGSIRTNATGFYTYSHAARWRRAYRVTGEHHDISNGYRYRIGVPGCALQEFSPQFFCDTMHSRAASSRGLDPHNASAPAPYLLFVGDSIMGNQIGALWNSQKQLRDIPGKLHLSTSLSACGVNIRSWRSDRLQHHQKGSTKPNPWVEVRAQ